MIISFSIYKKIIPFRIENNPGQRSIMFMLKYYLIKVILLI